MLKKLDKAIDDFYKEEPKMLLVVELYPAQVGKIMDSLEIISHDYVSFRSLLKEEVEYIKYRGAKITVIKKLEEKTITI